MSPARSTGRVAELAALLDVDVATAEAVVVFAAYVEAAESGRFGDAVAPMRQLRRRGIEVCWRRAAGAAR